MSRFCLLSILGHAKEINIRDGLQNTAESHQNLYTYFSAVALSIPLTLCLLLTGCSRGAPGELSADDRIATQVAATLTAEADQVAQAPSETPTTPPTATEASAPTDTATATPVPPTATPSATATEEPTATPAPPTVTSTPSPTPTLIQLVIVPVDGDDGNQFLRGSAEQNQGRNVLLPGFTPQEVSDPMVFRERMVFAVEVFDTRVGRTDGAGIDRVFFDIVDEGGDGNTVYDNLEENPGYCVFGGGTPECAVLVFEQTGNRWPNGEPIRNGAYQAQISIFAENGEQTQWRWGFQIDIPGNQAPPPADPYAEELHAEIVQIGSPAGLVFRVEAWDPAAGTRDGAGIANVDLTVLGPDGAQVWQRTEQEEPYCLFSNPSGSSTCNVWELASRGYQWPSGQPVQLGTHTLRATVNAQDGRSRTVETVVELE
jgi:hypothetical protein